MKQSTLLISVASLFGTFIGGFLLALIFAKAMATNDTTGWAALGGVIMGLVFGPAIGSTTATLITGKLLKARGSVGFALLGGALVIPVTFGAIALSARGGSYFVLALSALLAASLPVLGYTKAWKH